MRRRFTRTVVLNHPEGTMKIYGQGAGNRNRFALFQGDGPHKHRIADPELSQVVAMVAKVEAGHKPPVALARLARQLTAQPLTPALLPEPLSFKPKPDDRAFARDSQIAKCLHAKGFTFPSA